MQEINRTVIQAHYQGHGHWFDAGTMRFFNSAIEPVAYRTDDGTKAYFVSSEQYDFESPRRYSVRVYDFETHDIDTVGEFQQFATKDEATTIAQSLAFGAHFVGLD